MMPRFRTLLAFIVALTMALSPVAGFAMGKSCQGMQQSMSVDGTAGASAADNGGMANCPCPDSMPNCGAMPQCQMASGCFGQCFASSGMLSAVTGQAAADLGMLKIAGNGLFTSRSITPPAPPPRA